MQRSVLVGLAIVVVFLITVGALWWLMPQPRTDVDYFVMGGMGTMVSMAVLFAVLLKNTKGALFKRRKP